MIKAPPFKPIHTCNDRMQAHPPPTQGCSVAASLASTQHRATAKKRATARSQIWWREDARSSPTAASQRREDAKGRRAPPAASQLRSVAKTRRCEEHPRGVAASQRREDARGPQRRGSVTASQRRSVAKTWGAPSGNQRRGSVAPSQSREDTKPSTSHLAASRRWDTDAKAVSQRRSVAASDRFRTHLAHTLCCRECDVRVWSKEV